MDLKTRIRDVPDFPKPGILFRDISPLLADPVAWKECIEKLAHFVAPMKPDMLAGIESRGFLITAPLSLRLGCGFMMVRKRGKLPGNTIPHTYQLEYGTDTIEIQDDAVKPGQRVWCSTTCWRPAARSRRRSRCCARRAPRCRPRPASSSSSSSRAASGWTFRSAR